MNRRLSQEDILITSKYLGRFSVSFAIVCMLSHSVVSDFATCGLQTTDLHHPWDFPVKNTGASCHFLLQEIFLTQGSSQHLSESPALAGGFFTTEPPGKPKKITEDVNIIMYLQATLPRIKPVRKIFLSHPSRTIFLCVTVALSIPPDPAEGRQG